MKKTTLLLPLYFVIFFGFMGYSMMITIFTPMFLSPNYFLLPQETPLSERTILLGISLFLYPFGQFLSSPALGAFSDHFGRKKILLYSLLFTTLCYVVIAYAIKTNQLSLLFVALFFAGLSEGNVTIAQSAIADVTKNHERGKFFGYIYMSASLAYVAGPLLGGKLSDPQAEPWFNPALPFWLICGLLFLTCLWVFVKFKETLVRESHATLHYFEALTNIKNVLSHRKFRYLFLTNFCLYLAIFGFLRSYPMYLVDEFHMDVSKLANYVAWVSVPIILVNAGAFSFLFKHTSPWKMSLFSALFLGIFLQILILPQPQEMLWVTLFLPSFFVATGLPASATLLSISANDREQGSVLGNNQSLQFLAEAVSGLIAGLIAAIFIKLSLIVLGAISLIAFVLYLGMKQEQRKES